QLLGFRQDEVLEQSLSRFISPQETREFTAFNHFAECSRELPRFFGADEARQRLLEHLVLAKPEQLRNRIVGLQDLAFEVRDEDGVGGVGDDDVRIEGAVPLGAPIGALDRPRWGTYSR